MRAKTETARPLRRASSSPSRLRAAGLALALGLWLCFLGAALVDCVFWRSQSPQLLGRYSFKFLAGAFLPLGLCFALGLLLLARPFPGALFRRRYLPLLLLPPVAAGLYALVLPGYRLDFFVIAGSVLLSLGLGCLAWRPRLWVGLGLPLLALSFLVLGAELLLHHRQQYFQRQLNYPHVKDLVYEGRPGGLMKPDMDLVLQGYGIWNLTRWRTNSMGFRNAREFAKQPQPGCLRALAVGDSFSVGFRLDQDESLPARVGRELAGAVAQVEVPNACLDDPVQAACYLDEHGFDFCPDVLVLTLFPGNDFTHVLFHLDYSRRYRLERGRRGVERIVRSERLPDEDAWQGVFATLQLPEAARRGEPVVLPYLPRQYPEFLHRLALGRLFFQRLALRHGTPGWGRGALIPGRLAPNRQPHPMDIPTGFGFFLKLPYEPVDRAYRLSGEVLDYIVRRCREERVPLLIVLAPQSFQVYPERWQANVDAYRLRPEAYDLERPNRWLADFCARRGVALLDPTQTLRRAAREEGVEFYIPRGDMHWNAEATRRVAPLVARRVLELVERQGGDY